MRPILILWHRYVGLLLAPFLTIAAVTGILLTWNAALERVFAPSLFVLAASAKAPQAALDAFELRDKALIAFPKSRIDGIDLMQLPVADAFLSEHRTRCGSTSLR